MTPTFFKKLRQLRDEGSQQNSTAVPLKVAGAMMVRDAADILIDYLVHHILLGVDFFFVTDNGSVDGTLDILSRFQEEGFLRFVQRNECGAQERIINELVRLAKADGYDWAMLFDADERLVLADKSIKDFLLRYEDMVISKKYKIGSLRINWAMNEVNPRLYGGIASETCTASLFKYATKSVAKLNHHVKSIVRIEAFNGLDRSAHSVRHIPGFCGTSTNAARCDHGYKSHGFLADRAVLVHFQARSFYEFVKKKDLGRVWVCCDDKAYQGKKDCEKEVKSIEDYYADYLSRQHRAGGEEIPDSMLSAIERMEQVRERLFE